MIRSQHGGVLLLFYWAQKNAASAGMLLVRISVTSIRIVFRRSLKLYIKKFLKHVFIWWPNKMLFIPYTFWQSMAFSTISGIIVNLWGASFFLFIKNKIWYGLAICRASNFAFLCEWHLLLYRIARGLCEQKKTTSKSCVDDYKFFTHGNSVNFSSPFRDLYIFVNPFFIVSTSVLA